MSDFVQLEKQFLAHDLQSANFLGILLLREIYLTIATLTNLCENLEIAVP